MIKIDLAYFHVVNFAMQQNQVPIIRELIIKNDSLEEVDNIVIHITIPFNFSINLERKIEKIPVESLTKLTDLNLNLSAKDLWGLTEAINTEIIIEIFQDDKILNSKSFPIKLLPLDQWGGVNVLPEMISAFVTPNDPQIASIIHRGASFLETWTGDPSFDEYQSCNPDRVKKQMAAIYEAISELGVIYSTYPASYEESGQRIRTSRKVIKEKIGTCIDMALLYASCLEAVGINPIIVIIKDHAFAGGWLVDKVSVDTVNDDISLLRKKMAEGINEIFLIETTSMNSGRNISFDSAAGFAVDHLKVPENFVLSVDIKRCRFASIRPIPLKLDDQEQILPQKTVESSRKSEVPEKIFQEKRTLSLEEIKITKQKIWERKLLDLTLRNNLVNIRITKKTLQLISVSINKLEDALADGCEFKILPKPLDWNSGLMQAGIYQEVHHANPMIHLVKKEMAQKRLHSYLNENELSKALVHLYRMSRMSMEENGANTLYLALGLLRWYETSKSERPRFAPILLLPVEIVRKSSQHGYVIRSREEEIMMNVTLLEMLRQDFEINIGGLDELPKDESGVDVKLVFNTIRKGIMNQKRWDVEEQSILGIFSFNKFIMWNDIHSNSDKLSRNKIVKGLITGLIDWKIAEDKSFDLDKEFRPADISLPVNADSSQMQAICSASNDESFVLHGPPGTGKSQTITNIIANALYHGKKVLFVAEKMAALSVVKKRLDNIGLSPFCLELHSNKAKKSVMLEQLNATTEVTLLKSPESYKQESERLQSLRCDLNKYVELLHKKQDIGFSLYDAINKYYGDVGIDDDFEFSKPIELEATEFIKQQDIVDRLQSTALLCGVICNHPLYRINNTVYTNSLKNEVETCIIHTIQYLDELRENDCEIFTLLDLQLKDSSILTLERYSDFLIFLLSSPVLLIPLLKSENLNEDIQLIRKIIPHGINRDKIKEELSLNFDSQLLDIDVEAFLLKWEQAKKRNFLSRFFTKRNIMNSLRKYSKDSKIKKENVFLVLKLISEYQKEKQVIESKGDFYCQLLGALWNDGECDWLYLEDGCNKTQLLTEKILEITGEISLFYRVQKQLAEKITLGVDVFIRENKTLFELSKTLITKFLDGLGTLDAKFELKDSFVCQNRNDDLKQELKRILDNLELLQDWCNWNKVKDEANENGLNEFVRYISKKPVSLEKIEKLFKKSVYKSVINNILDAEPVLSNFNGKLFEDKIKKFKTLTIEFEKLTKKELYAKLASNLPSFVKEASRNSEVGILQRCIRNKGRGMSIRKLFDSTSTLLSRINPCMLMSPMSVAQYLNPENIEFDLVVFDEASQIPTSESIGAIARAKNVIVVGDPNQMPPTNFFSSNHIDEDNIDKEDLESILDDCLALSMPSKHLLWHYRSKHESLIAFCNSQYYGNKLFTFPSPDDIKSNVTYQYVNGFYDKGKSRQNKSEAEAIVREILRRFSDPILSKRSIGVVTFSSVQQTLIEDLLTEALINKPELEALAYDSYEPVFIKNLENVQGDERDVILFSIGYGPDQTGKIGLNFGPLNRDGGWRRLNVAVSRARYEMKVFSTFHANQLDLSRTSSEGVAGLKAFLEYAEEGKKTLSSEASPLDINDGFIDLVAAKLIEKGYEVHTNIGCSGYHVDLGIVDPKSRTEYLLGILCDGQNYKNAETVKDREVLQIGVLEMLGWFIHRIWILDWINNSERVFESIIEAIQKAEEKKEIIPRINQEYLTSEEVTSKEVVLTKLEKSDSGYKLIYKQCPIDKCGIRSEEFTEPYYTEIVVKQIRRVLEVESPISRNQLCRRVLSMWDISRIGVRIDKYFESIFTRINLKRTAVSDREVFFWRDDQNPDDYMYYRKFMEKASDISPEEVSVAVKELLEEQISLPKEELIKEVARLFGFLRSGLVVRKSMQNGIEKAIDRGFARLENDRVFIAR